jgi:hypothetical protein
MSETCEGCVFHKRESGDRWQVDTCYERPGAPVERQKRNEYWSTYPLACSLRKTKESDDE